VAEGEVRAQRLRGVREGEVACPFIVLLFGMLKVLSSSNNKRLGSV
jgi:hypothetical protein